jgi:hypothetical protein
LKKINISIKKNKIERKRNENAILRTAKGATHNKGSLVVQESMAHGKVLGHDNTVRRYRGVFLCRALISLFAVLVGFAVCFSSPLACDNLCRALVLCFAVRMLFAVRWSCALLCMCCLSCVVVASHGKVVFAVRMAHSTVWLHGNVCFFGSACILSEIKLFGIGLRDHVYQTEFRLNVHTACTCAPPCMHGRTQYACTCG